MYLTANTKNLFDINNAVPYDFNSDSASAEDVWVKDGIYTTRINNYNLGSGLRIKNGWVLPAGTYTMSLMVVDSCNLGTNGFANIGFRYKIADGTWQVANAHMYEYTPGTTLYFSFYIPEHTELRLYINYQNLNGQLYTGFISYKDIQVEKGSTATPYVPCGYLQMYRMKYKVSNVCQLYNKSVARLPWVESGITVSVDGNSVVFNGTATSNVWVYFSMVPTSIIGGHKYYFGDLPYIEGNDNRFSFYLAYTSGKSIVWLTNNELKKIFVPLKSGNVYFMSRVLEGMICNNFKITPQLFDLTEMYGAGNEPTTIEEFRKDFPDEYYEYSPNTYLTTHSRKLITSANTSISFN